MTKVLDHGFIELVGIMGDDYRVLQSARVSTGGVASKGDAQDKGLIRYLYKNGHVSPFDQVVMTWHVKAPIFVLRQWMRHWSWRFNEYSGRYSEMIEDMYVPETFKMQSPINHQGSGEEFSDEDNSHYISEFQDIQGTYLADYRSFLEKGMAKEQARMVLPVSQYSEMYGTVSLRDLFSFFEQRLDEHAQWEIRQYAGAMLSILESRSELKWSIGTFNEFRELKSIYNKCINAAKKDTKQVKMTLQKLLSELEQQNAEAYY